MIDLKKEFPVTSAYTYLNTPFTGVLSSEVSKKIQDMEEDYRSRGSAFTNENEHQIIEDTKSLIAEIYNSKVENIGILNNFSTGFNLILNDLPDSSKVVLLTQDYPSVNLPVKSRRFQIHEVDINQNLNENLRKVFLEEKPDFFMFSMTQFISGLTFSMKDLEQLKREFPEVSFMVDATQYCGTEPFDFENSPFDVFGTSGYKWLNASLGNAFFLFKSSFLNRFNFRTVGSNSLTSKPDSKLRLTGFLEPGHHDLLAVARLKFALEFHYKRVGIEFIESTIKTLSKQAKAKFFEMNLLDREVVDADSYQNIFSLKGDEKLMEKLQHKGILSAHRGGRIRVGFQYFNTGMDLEILLNGLRENS
jgi:cysteine desulfurase/selenocysteine lyase